MNSGSPPDDELKTVEQKPGGPSSHASSADKVAGAGQASQKPVPGAQPPEEEKAADLREPRKVAAGLEAAWQSAKFTLRESGLARGLSTWTKVNQKNGFDCQSCAWPSPDEDRHLLEFCENGTKAMASEATRKRIDAEFFRTYSIADLLEKSDFWLEQQGRLTRPMIKRENATHYEPVEWKAAFELLGRELNALPDPNAAAFYTSGRTSNEAAFLYQLFVRQFGTNNLPDCSNMCHESSGEALNETIGIGKGTVTLKDFEQTDCIFIIGQNPGTNHPRMMTSLERAKKNGATIVSLNPMPEPGLMRVTNPNPQEYDHLYQFPGKMLLNRGVKLTDLWLPVRINGDMAALRGIMKEMLAMEEARPGIFDRTFIREQTLGFEAYAAHLRAASWEEILEGSGLGRGQIREAAEIAAKSRRMICCWAMGLTQHRNAVATIQEVVNFLLLGGHIGRPGAGACPVRGHSNVQGDRTMGVWERVNDVFLEKLGSEFHFTPPTAHGTDAVETIKQMHEGLIRFFFALGGNFLSATPDTEYTARALQRCRLTAQVSTKLNRSHLITGEIALILPCLGRSEKDLQASGEQFVTVEDSMGIINPSRGHLPPASEYLRSEPAIVAGLALAVLGEKTGVDWNALASDYDRIRDHIANVIPGFENFNNRIKQDIFHLPNLPRDEGKFNTPGRRARFTVSPLTTVPLEKDQYLMMTIRSHDQFNTTIYGLNDRYRGIYNGRRVVFMNAGDIKEASLQQGQLVDLTSHYQGETRTARHFMVAPFDIPKRCTATYFPEANVLVSINSTAERSNTPASKSVVISITPSSGGEEAAMRPHSDAG